MKKTPSNNHNVKWTYRTKLILSILAPIGILLSFVITNFENINKLLWPTQFAISTTNENLHRNLNIKIDGNNVNIIAAIESFQNGIDIEMGSYHISVFYYGDKLWEQDVYIHKGSKTIVSIPDVWRGNISVSAVLNTKIIYQGQPLDLEIRSSGNGCLWIYDVDGDIYNRIYPTNEICSNIIAGIPRTDITLLAGENEFSDIIVFLVTASSSLDTANNIMNTQFVNIPSKGSLNTNKTNWGIDILEYEISNL